MGRKEFVKQNAIQGEVHVNCENRGQVQQEYDVEER